MKRVNIGSTGIEIAPLAFGGNIFGWTVDEKQSFELLDAFTDRGFNCVDTSDVYSRFVPGLQGGESETIIGSWFAQGGGRRERTILCTKVGIEMGPGLSGLSRAYIRQAVEASLRRLKTDYIDLYISHMPDPATPIEETLAAYDELIRQGKVRAIGASNYSPEGLTQALGASREKGLPAYQSLQPLYNLYDREAYENALESVCEKNSLSVFPYFALASGFLTGKYRQAAAGRNPTRESFVGRYLNDRGNRILTAMDAVAAETQLTLAQIALAWLLSRPTVTAPVASATSLRQLEDVLGAVEAQLTPGQLARLDAASAPAAPEPAAQA
jgi:aryl-alcohol dehydrogenase-like predicted oxidoreductase